MNEPRLGAESLHPELESVWAGLRPAFARFDGFWLGFVFGALRLEIDEFVARSADLARPRNQQVDLLELRTPSTAEVLTALAAPAPGRFATWVVDTGTADRDQRWMRLLHQLNPRSDELAATRSGALLLCCPADLSGVVGDAAARLWSMRQLAATIEQSAFAPEPLPPTSADPVDIGGPATTGSRAVAPFLRRAAIAMSEQRIDDAGSAARAALAAAAGPDDIALAHGWLARALAMQEDPLEAQRHAQLALQQRRPFWQDMTTALLEILADSDSEDALPAAESIVKARREAPDTVVDLRSLSLALDRAAELRELRGDLDAALGHYTESLELARRIHDVAGDGPQALRDISISLNNVANLHRRHDNLDAAMAHYAESLDLRRQIRACYGDTAKALGDLHMSLVNVARARDALGDPASALELYREALTVDIELDTAYGPPHWDAERAADLQGDLAELRARIEA